MTDTRRYATLEIRILKREEEGYPVELTLDGSQQFRGGYLQPDILPWVPGDSPKVDGERLFNLLFADDKLQCLVRPGPAVEWEAITTRPGRGLGA